jgi:hypothetical protein
MSYKRQKNHTEQIKKMIKQKIFVRVEFVIWLYLMCKQKILKINSSQPWVCVEGGVGQEYRKHVTELSSINHLALNTLARGSAEEKKGEAKPSKMPSAPSSQERSNYSSHAPDSDHKAATYRRVAA